MANEFVVKNGLVSPNVQLQGSTSGTVTLTAPAVAGTTAITLPSTAGTLVTTGDTGTVTNTMLAGSIANAKLVNSAVTVGSTSISLGASSTTLAGLTSVTSTTFVGALTGNASTATTLQTARTIALSGDVAGSVSFDGSANATISATIQPDSVALGTDTTGNYMVNVSAGTGVSVSHTPAEGSTATVSIGQAVGTTDNVTFNNVTVNGTLTSDDITSASISVAGNATITGNLTVSGTTTTINSTTIAIADLNLELARNATTATQANGAGITVTGPATAATLTYSSTDDRWNLNKNLNITRVYGTATNVSNVHTAGSYLTGGTFDGSAAITWAVDATPANTFSKVVARDSSGNFSASTITATLAGNASTASSWQTARTLSYTGDATGSLSVDGSTNVSTALTLAASGVTAGSYTYSSITVDAKGRVTAASSGAAPVTTSVSATSPIVTSGSTGSITLSHANSGVTAGTYNNVTVNATGHVTSGSNVSYLTSYSETDTLATVTGRGASTSTASTFSGGLTATGITVSKSGTDSTITFPAQTNDPGYIKHYESNNTAIMYFSVSDDAGANDYFSFGNTSSGYVEGFRITASGVVSVGTWQGSSISTSYTDAKITSISATSPIVASASTGAVTLSHADSGVTAGTYNNVTVNAKGHVTSGSNVSYLTSYSETDTLASVTGRGFTTRASSGTFATANQGNPGLEIIGAGGTEPAYMTFHRPSVYAIRLGLDGSDLKVGGWSMGNASYKLWHEGNDGSGSTLDADLLDGNHASYFATADHNHTYNVNNVWLRENGDDGQFQMYGNTRTMIYRTDGNTNPHGGGGYAHIFYYGGSNDNQRMFIINTDGRLYSPYHGWLDTMSVAYASSAGSASTADNIDNWGFVNTGSNSATNADTINSNGISYVQSMSLLAGGYGGTQSDGALYSQRYSDSWQHQIYGDYRSGQIVVRGKNNGTWTSWRTVPTSYVGDSAPTYYNNGDFWWQSSTGKLKVAYYDGNSTQWVDAVPIPDTSTFFSKAGGAITGPVVMSSSLTVGGNTYLSGSLNIAGSTLPSWSSGVNASHLVQRDANGYIYANYVNHNTSETENPTVNSIFVSNGDGWTRKASQAHIISQLGLWTTGNYGSVNENYRRNWGEFSTNGGQDFLGRGKRCIVATTGDMIINYGGDFGSVVVQSGMSVSGSLTIGGNTALHAGNYNSYSPTLTGGNASGTWGINVSGYSTYISASAPQLASATESNDIYISAPSYSTDTPVKLLNFNWYSNVWSIGNIRSGATPSNGFGVYYTGSGVARVEVARWDTSKNFINQGNVTAYSDITLKSNITVIENALEKVQAIRGVTYNRKDIENNPRHIGVIAQEVEIVLPEVITENADGVKSVAYGNMVGLLIEAIKEQQKQIEELKAEVRALKG